MLDGCPSVPRSRRDLQSSLRPLILLKSRTGTRRRTAERTDESPEIIWLVLSNSYSHDIAV